MPHEPCAGAITRRRLPQCRYPRSIEVCVPGWARVVVVLCSRVCCARQPRLGPCQIMRARKLHRL